jgi:hypothetical protein
VVSHVPHSPVVPQNGASGSVQSSSLWHGIGPVVLLLSLLLPVLSSVSVPPLLEPLDESSTMTHAPFSSIALRPPHGL